MLDDTALLELLIADDRRADPRFRPTPYWQVYADRIVDELRRVGLEDFRRNQRILKGFGEGGALQPAVPPSRLKRAVWQGVSGAPVVTRIIGEYERLLRVYQKRLRTSQITVARLVMDRIAARFPELSIPDGIDAGGADDAFEWRGRTVTADFVMYLSRAADFYERVDPADARWLIEIGPGLALSTFAHVALNRRLAGVVNLDIVPTIYISTRLLASSPSIEVIDYKAVHGLQEVVVAEGARPRVYSLPAWMLPRVKGRFDYGFNAFSFQEMEEDVCAAYAADLLARLDKGVMMLNSEYGHKAGAGGQHKPVTLGFLTGLFEKSFPRLERVDGLFCEVYGGRPASSALMRR